MRNKKVLLTGANGFVGRHILTECIQQGYDIVAPTRQPLNCANGTVYNPIIVDILDICELQQFDKNIGTIIHVAGLAHRHGIPMSEFLVFNSAYTLKIAEKAVEVGIRRFIFFSSIGVNGSVSQNPFVESDEPSPKEDYAKSKFDAEEKLLALSKSSGLELIIIRPPLVYGPDAPGNFAKLLNLVKSGMPIPLGKINNKRSFISVFNLSSFVISCIKVKTITQEVFLVSDNEDISTTELLTLLYKKIRRPSRLIKVNYKLLHRGLKIVGKSNLLEKLCCDLQLSSEHSMVTLGWKPPYSVEKSLDMCQLDSEDSK